MFDLDNIQEIFATLSRNKMRSFLTCLGVFWGVFILFILVSAGSGFKNSFKNLSENENFRTINIFPSETKKAYKGYKSNRTWALKLKDINLLKSKVPEITNICPIISCYQNSNIEYKKQSTNRFGVKGVNKNYFTITGLYPTKGRVLNEKDERQKRKVCVIGEEVEKQFFGQEDAIGKSLKLSNIDHKIVGILKKKPSSLQFGYPPEYSIYVPISTAQIIERKGEEISALFISTHKTSNMEKFKEDISRTIKEEHNIAPDDEKALFIVDSMEFAKIMDTLFLSFDLLIWLVGIGTLLSGIIGISNIMLVSIRERTRDIGVRRAIGAKPKDIIIQIMSESVIITLLSGGTAIIVGTIIMGLTNSIVNSEAFINGLIPFSNALLALIIIIIGGLIAGLLPTIRAIKIKAIDAIRDE